MAILASTPAATSTKPDRLLQASSVERGTTRWSNIRVLEFAGPTKLFALNAARVVRVTLDFLLPTRHTGNGQPLPRLPRLCDTPVGINSLPVDNGLAMATVVVEVAQALSRHLRRSHKSGEKMCPRPDPGAEPIPRRHALGRSRRGTDRGGRRGKVNRCRGGRAGSQSDRPGLMLVIDGLLPTRWSWGY